MPYSIEVDRSNAAAGVARVRFGGTVTGPDIVAATDALVAHPAYEPGLDQLWTLADVAELVIGPDEMEALVAHDRGLALRYYALRLRAAGQDVRVFVTEAAAEDWLRVPHALRVAL